MQALHIFSDLLQSKVLFLFMQLPLNIYNSFTLSLTLESSTLQSASNVGIKTNGFPPTNSTKLLDKLSTNSNKTSSSSSSKSCNNLKKYILLFLPYKNGINSFFVLSGPIVLAMRLRFLTECILFLMSSLFNSSIIKLTGMPVVFSILGIII